MYNFLAWLLNWPDRQCKGCGRRHPKEAMQNPPFCTEQCEFEAWTS